MTTHSPDQTAARQAIDAVLADPVFGQITEDAIWRWRDVAAGTDNRAPPWLSALGEAIDLLAEALRSLLWVAALAASVIVLYLLLRYRAQYASPRRQDSPPGPAAFDLRPASLPSDVAAAARAALAAGNAGEALSLLYRGALFAMIQGQQMDFLAADTEEDCLLRVAGRLDATAERCFGDIVGAWQRVAYGWLPLGAGQVEQLVTGWQACFGARRGQT